MNIEGNIKTANKFYIRTKDNNILWVPNIEIAKKYVNDPNNKKWYLHTIYATNEEIVKGYDNKNYLKSQLPEKPILYKKVEDFEIFKNQALQFLKNKLLEIANKNKFDTIEEMISWKDSNLLDLNKLGQKGLKYRDTCYLYYFNCLEEYKNKFDQNNLEKNSIFYKDFVLNFPKF